MKRLLLAIDVRHVNMLSPSSSIASVIDVQTTATPRTSSWTAISRNAHRVDLDLLLASSTNGGMEWREVELSIVLYQLDPIFNFANNNEIKNISKEPT